MILPEELQIEPWPPRQMGGQRAGTGPNGVKIVHIPTGLVACCASAQSQHRNKQIAMDMILGGLTSPHYR